MNGLPSIKKLEEKYKLDEDRLLKIIHECVKYYLSEEELFSFILEYYMKREDKFNKRLQTKFVTTI